MATSPSPAGNPPVLSLAQLQRNYNDATARASAWDVQHEPVLPSGSRPPTKLRPNYTWQRLVEDAKQKDKADSKCSLERLLSLTCRCCNHSHLTAEKARSCEIETKCEDSKKAPDDKKLQNFEPISKSKMRELKSGLYCNMCCASMRDKDQLSNHYYGTNGACRPMLIAQAMRAELSLDVEETPLEKLKAIRQNPAGYDLNLLQQMESAYQPFYLEGSDLSVPELPGAIPKQARRTASVEARRAVTPNKKKTRSPKIARKDTAVAASISSASPTKRPRKRPAAGEVRDSSSRPRYLDEQSDELVDPLEGNLFCTESDDVIDALLSTVYDPDTSASTPASPVGQELQQVLFMSSQELFSAIKDGFGPDLSYEERWNVRSPASTPRCSPTPHLEDTSFDGSSEEHNSNNSSPLHWPDHSSDLPTDLPSWLLPLD